MTKEKGLTGIREDARGFVGSRPAPEYDRTKNGRPRIKFCIACGKTNEDDGKYPTWRYCIGYDKVAEILKDIKVGNLVKVSGWVSTESQVDEYYKPVLDEFDRPKKREVLILYKAEVAQYDKKPELQPSLIS